MRTAVLCPNFSERDLRSLDHICEQVGFFLRNARLYEQAERNQRRLEVLNNVSRRLAAVIDPEEVLTIKAGLEKSR